MNILPFPAHPGAPLVELSEAYWNHRKDLQAIVEDTTMPLSARFNACSELLETAPWPEFALLWKDRAEALLREAAP